MIIDNAVRIIGPIVLIFNFSATFMCLRRKRGALFTIAVYAAYALALSAVTYLTGIMDMPIATFSGVLFLPINLLLFRGQISRIVFAFFMPYQLTALMGNIAEALVGISIGYENPYALLMFLMLSFLMMGVYLVLVLRYGRRLIERMFVEGRRSEWNVYALGAIFTFILILTLKWTEVGAPLYFALMLFILWSIGVLCFTIINTHEKTAQEHQSETLKLQVNAMRDQIDAEKTHREAMATMRHDMRHEMAVIMELYRQGKADEAEAVYTDWQTTLEASVPKDICAEPILNAVFTRFARRGKKKDIQLYVKSNISAELPIDTIKLSVILSNALENAMNATGEIEREDMRAIRVKIIQNDGQIALEVVNPCAAPVEFNSKGLPITNKLGHGFGVRSIAAFALDNDYMLDFKCADGKFTMWLVMDVGEADATGKGD